MPRAAICAARGNSPGLGEAGYNGTDSPRVGAPGYSETNGPTGSERVAGVDAAEEDVFVGIDAGGIDVVADVAVEQGAEGAF